MENRFRALISGRSHLLVRLSGPLNEAADFEPVRFATKPAVEIDMGETTSINSLGIRMFKAWSGSLANEVIELSHVPKFFVDQLNMIPNLMPPRTRLVSFYVPYYCEEKDLEKSILYRRGLEFDKKDGKITLQHPQILDEDNNEYFVDVIENKYFRFLESYA